MSTASTSRTIRFLSKSGTYTAMLISPQGNIFQEYKKKSDGTFDYLPDFAIMDTDDCPIINFICTSSRTTGAVTVNSIDWYYNDTKITFDAEGNSAGLLTGYFKKVSPSGAQLYHGLRITGNLAVISPGVPVLIKAVATIVEGTGQAETMQAVYTIPITAYSPDTYKVVIVAGDGKNFVIDTHGGSVKLTAKVYYQGAEQPAGNFTYAWFKMSSGSWQSCGSGQTLTVNEGDVGTYADFKVEVKDSSNALIGSDIQGVVDVQDPLDIRPNPVPEDETIVQGSGGSVKYTPVVVSRSGVAVSGTYEFRFTLLKGNGDILPGKSNVIGTTFEVTEADCIAAGYSEVELVIEATEV